MTTSNPILVGVMGYAQAGKDTFGTALGYHRIAFADALKDLALAAGPRFWEFRDPDGSTMVNWSLGAIVCEYGWEFAKAQVPGVREFLQNLGVGARNVIGPNVWVDAAFLGYDPAVPTVITDVRFPNELEAIHARGGLVVKVVREGHKPPNQHISELYVDEAPVDIVVEAPYNGIEVLQRQALLLDENLRRGA